MPHPIRPLGFSILRLLPEIPLIPVLVLRPCPHPVVGNDMEHLREYLGVRVRPRVPEILERRRQWICNQCIFRRVPVIAIRTDAHGLEVRIGDFVVLGFQEAEVFAGEAATEGGRKAAGFPGLPVHSRVDEPGVFDYAGDFGVVVAELRAVVEVGGADDGNAVVGDENLRLLGTGVFA